MLTNRNAVLACLMLASFAGCGGRSGLDDFANGADDLIPGSRGGAKINADGGATNGSGNEGGDADVTPKEDAGPAEPAPAERGEIGAQCMGDKACNGATSTCLQEIPGAMGQTTRFPNGYCTVENCGADGQCPAGSGCLEAYGVLNCMQRCDDESDCRTEDGYECGLPEGSSDPGTYCIPPFIDATCAALCRDAESARMCTEQMNPRLCFGGGGNQGGGGNRGGN